MATLPVATRVASTAASARGPAGRRPSDRSVIDVDADDLRVVEERGASRELFALGRGHDDPDVIAVLEVEARRLGRGQRDAHHGLTLRRARPRRRTSRGQHPALGDVERGSLADDLVELAGRHRLQRGVGAQPDPGEVVGLDDRSALDARAGRREPLGCWSSRSTPRRRAARRGRWPRSPQRPARAVVAASVEARAE